MCPSCESSNKQVPASVQIQRGMHDMTRLNGKTAVITGGATGIGLAAARSGGGRGGGCLSRVVGQQLHDRQRGRRRWWPSATLTPARDHACQTLQQNKTHNES